MRELLKKLPTKSGLKQYGQLAKQNGGQKTCFSLNGNQRG
jgi:hypothetical protein